MRIITITFLFFCLNSIVAAEETNYTSPADITDEQRASLMGSSAEYSSCLRKEAGANAEKFQDFRQVADAAMKGCEPVQESMKKLMTKMNLDPGYQDFFVHKTSSKSANKLLQELMMSQ